MSKSKCAKHTTFGPLLDVEACFVWQAQGILHPAKSEAGVGHWKRICKDAICRAGAVRETCSADMFSDVRVLISMCRVAFWSIRSSGLLRWFCVTGALRMTWLHFFVVRSTLDRWNGKIAKHIVTRPSALDSSFQFWRKSRRTASFFMFSIWKIEEVSQNCFSFDVVKFKNWGSRRLALFLTLSTSKIEEVAQNCCVFDVQYVQKLKISRRIAAFSSLQAGRQTDRHITIITVIN